MCALLALTSNPGLPCTNLFQLIGSFMSLVDEVEPPEPSLNECLCNAEASNGSPGMLEVMELMHNAHHGP